MRVLLAFSLTVLLTACNFHEVDPGRYYRSGQMRGKELEATIKEYGIRTVINLRGANPGEKWYRDEKRVTDRLGVLQIDIPMSASRLPHKQDLIALLEAFRNAPRPILLHCRAGVDRTGEASAIYQMLYMGKSRKQALQMLSPYYGHFEQFMPAKKYFIRKVWQGEQWAYDSYDPCGGNYEYYNASNPLCTGGLYDLPLTENDDT